MPKMMLEKERKAAKYVGPFLKQMLEEWKVASMH